MADNKPGPAPTRREQAKLYLIAHPEASDSDVKGETGIDLATVGRARGELINEGLLSPATRKQRRTPPAIRPSEVPVITGPKPGGPRLDTLLTDADLRALSEGDIDDEQVRKRILTALRTIAFAPGMNYETAMNAMSLWVKLKDQASTKELGPGAPVTYAIAKERLMSLMKACGFELVFECFQELFVPKESTDASQEPSGSAGTPETVAGSSPGGVPGA